MSKNIFGDFEISENTKKFLFAASPYWIIAFIICMGGLIIIDILTPPIPFNPGWVGILKFLTICAGIGWIIHGTGFLIVKA